MASLFAVDLLIIVLTYVAILMLSTEIRSFVTLAEVKEYQIFSPLLGLSMLSFYISGRYEVERSRQPGLLLFSLIPAIGAVFLCYLVLSYFIVSLRLDNLLLVIFLCSIWLLVFAWRWLGVPAIKLEPRRVLIIGRNRLTERIVQILTEEKAEVYTIADHWHRSSPATTLPAVENYVQENKIDVIVYAADSKLVAELAGSLYNLRLKEKNIFADHSFFQRITGKIPLDYIDDVGMLVNSHREVWCPRLRAAVKRMIDLTVVLLLTPLAVPLVILCGLAIKLTSKGPMIFIQERLGHNEVPFKLIKLRTMVQDAEKLCGPKWSSDRDPRITAVGRFLRKTRLDELPQLFNVLKGEMSLIGPRPIRKHFADLLAEEVPNYRLRFLVKPGLTGWAQVSCDYGSSIEGQKEKVKHDLFYLVRRSFTLDFFIMLKTVRVLIAGKGI